MKNKKKILGIATIFLVVIAIFLSAYFLLDFDSNDNDTKVEMHLPLYKACDDDSCIYVLGTFHMGDNELYGLTDTVWNAYKESDAIAFELDTSVVSEEDTTEYLFLSDDDDLSNYLSQEQFELLEEFCSKHLLSIDVIRTLNLAGASSILEEWLYLELGYIAENGVDTQLLNKAHDDNKEIIELESYEFQMNLLFGFPDEYYVNNIENTIQNYDAIKKATDFLYHNYLYGNILILKQLIATDDNSDELEEEYNQKMLVERNINMSEQAEQFLKENKKVMIAVGAAHVIGEKGIIETLEEKGYQVTLVK